MTSSTVDEGATLHILTNGSLDLKDSASANLGSNNRSGIWSTGNGSAGATRMEFNMDDGNLILCDSSGAIVWETRLNNGSP
ncbi:hypothetical protein Mapa_004566 [Marchantia paleacea]|nr:hypothetical protein Mapa_004566 [Marchantia paleacea]